MSDALNVPELPFPTTPSHPGVWRRDRPSSAVVAAAPAHTDLYLNPGGADAADAGSMINAATLLGTPPSGDFQFSARVSVDFQARYDAGVLLLWVDEQRWAKLCFEFSPASQPMVVSVGPVAHRRRLHRHLRPDRLHPATPARSTRRIVTSPGMPWPRSDTR